MSAAGDINERQRMEQPFRVMIESAPVAMLLFDRGGVIELVNTQAEKLFGYSRDELLGNSVEMLLPERYRTAHSELPCNVFNQAAARSLDIGRGLSGLRKNGSEFPIEVGLNPVDTDDGESLVVSIVDITDWKSLEDNLRQRNEELESRVLEITNALATANAMFAQRDVEWRQFSYVVSHDLQAPLRGVAGFAQFLKEDYQGKLDATADEYIQQIIAGVQRMQHLVSDLATYSRVDSRADRFVRTDMTSVLDDAMALLRAKLDDVEGEVTHDNLPTVVGDPAQLSQLLLHLIGNSCKYRGDNPLRVHVTSERNGSNIVIAVRDNGIGIDAKYFESIFEIFRRLHPQGKYSGTGIGLAICRRIVRRHGGRIWVESEVGKGSVFYFTVREFTE